MRWQAVVMFGALALGAAGCGGDPALQGQRAERLRAEEYGIGQETIWDVFRIRTDPQREINVNRYLWLASLDVLSFLPLEATDPFSGVLVTGWGRPAGSGTAYRATVYVTDPALDARALKVAAFRQSGGRAVPVSDAENRQIEDAILTRARQLRIAEARRG